MKPPALSSVRKVPTGRRGALEASGLTRLSGLHRTVLFGSLIRQEEWLEAPVDGTSTRLAHTSLYDTPTACQYSGMAIFRVPFNIVFVGAGSPGANIWHIRTIDPSPTTELNQANTLIGYIHTFYVALLAYFPNGTTISLGTVTEEGTQREIVPTFAPVLGTGTGNSPQALCAVVTWRTSIAARRGRGRTFVGPLNTGTVQSDGTLNDTFRANVIAAASALVSSSTAYGNGAVGVYGYSSAKLKGSPRDPNDPRVLRDYVGSTVRDLFGILRSRRD